MQKCMQPCKEERVLCLGTSVRDSGGPQTIDSNSPGSAFSFSNPSEVVIDLHKSLRLTVASLGPRRVCSQAQV